MTTSDHLRSEVEAMIAGDPVDDDREPRVWEPFPLEVLPPAIVEWIEAKARATGTAPETWVLPLLACLSGCIGDARRVRVGGHWTEPLVLWVAAVAPSGAGKTIAPKDIFRPVRRADALWKDDHDAAMLEHARTVEAATERYKLDLAEWKKATKAGDPDAGDPPTKPAADAPTRRRTTVGDVTIEKLVEILAENPRGVVCVRDELAGWIRSLERYTNGSDRPLWLELYEGDRIQVDRIGRGTIEAACGWCAIFGGIQPDTLHSMLGADDLASGLLPRFIVAWPPFGDGRMTLAEDGVDARPLERLVDALLAIDGDGEPIVLPLDPDAAERFVAWRNGRVPEVREAGGAMGSTLSKANGLALRLAAILELAWAHDLERDRDGRGPASVESVSLASVERGIRIAEWSSREWCRVVELLFGTSPVAGGAARGIDLVAFAEERGGTVSPREVRDAFRRAFPTSTDAAHALSQLVADGIGRWEWTTPGEAGGRPSRRFVLG